LLQADEWHQAEWLGWRPFTSSVQSRRGATSTLGVYYLRIRFPEDGRQCPFVLADHLRMSDRRSNGLRAPIATGAPFASVWSRTITCSCAVTTAASRSRFPSAEGAHGSWAKCRDDADLRSQTHWLLAQPGRKPRVAMSKHTSRSTGREADDAPVTGW